MAMDLDGYTPSFQKFLHTMPSVTEKSDGTYRDLSHSERVNMALCQWLKKALHEIKGDRSSKADEQPNRFGHV